MIQLQSFLILALILVFAGIGAYLLERATAVLSGAIPVYRQEVDFTGGGLGPTTYSDNVLDRARQAIELGHVTASADGRVARVRSLSGGNTYTATLVLVDGEVAGGRCTCANGRKGGAKAHCYHVAALEMIFTGEETRS